MGRCSAVSAGLPWLRPVKQLMRGPLLQLPGAAKRYPQEKQGIRCKSDALFVIY